MTAVSRGLRASNSSTTRGRPPVMSLVLVVSRGIFAMMSPGVHRRRRPSTIRCACDGIWYVFSTLLLSFADFDRGCFFSSGESMTTRRDRPVTSSTSSWTVTPSFRSLNLTCPATSVRIANVNGSHSTSSWPCSTVLAVLDAHVRAVDDLVALAARGPASSMTISEPLRFIDDAARPCGVSTGLQMSSNLTVPSCRASCVDCSSMRDAVPPMWNVRIVSCVPGSPIDCAAMTPTASPISTSRPVARLRP